MFDDFVPPTNEDSDDYKPRDHYGNACIVKVREHKAGIATVNGEADAIFADIHDMNESATYRNVMLMGGAFVDAFKPYLGKLLVIAWEKKTSTANRPYAVPRVATIEEIKLAEAVVAKSDPFAETVHTIDAEPPF